MSVETDLYSLLSGDGPVAALVSRRIYPGTMPQDNANPAIAYFRITTTPVNSMTGYSNLERVRMQIDCWAESSKAARELAAAVRTAMDGATAFSSLCLDDHDIFEDETETYRVSLDFSLWQ